MARVDLHNRIDVERLVAHTTLSDNTATVGSIVDTANYHSTEMVMHLGTLADADATFDVLIEHGDDSGLSDAAEVDGNDIIGGDNTALDFDFNDDDAFKAVGYKGIKRYLRVTVTPSANTGSATFSGVAVQGNKRAKLGA